MNKRLPALLAAALALPALASAQTTTTSAALWTEFQATPYTHSHIPNVSFAGYQRGEVPIPDVPVVANVLDFGAVGDGETFNDAAFLRAMNAANQAGGGAVWIPNGHYLLRNTMLVHHSGVVLRGESRDGVILNFTRPLMEAPGFGPTGHGTQHYNWMGGLIWVSPRNPFFNLRSDEEAIWNWDRRDLDHPDWAGSIGGYENWRPREVLTSVPQAHPAGVRTLTVEDGSALQPGELVFMTWEDPKEEGPLRNALFKEMAGHSAFDNHDFGDWLNSARYFLWPVEIASVDGNEVTLMQPIRMSIEPHYNVRIRSVAEQVREVGLENFTILMNNTRESYSYNDGVGWNGIYFNQAYNSWARNIRIVNSEAAMHVSSSKNLTLKDFVVENTVQIKYISTARNMTSDVLFKNFTFTGTGQVNNGINTEYFSTGNVWTGGHMERGTFDSHRMMAFDFVRTDIWMTNPSNSRPGGNSAAGPFAGRRAVHWNVTIDQDFLPEELRRDPGAEAEWVFEPFQYSMGAQIGIRGADMFEKSNLFGMPSGDKGMLIGEAGIEPAPANLYDAQVALRHSTEASIIPAISSLWFIPVSDVTIPVVAHPPVGTTIAEVRAYLDGDLITTSSSAPYTLSWNNPVPGRYWLELELLDNLGGSTWSAPRQVTIAERVILEHDGLINYRPDFEVVEHPFFRQGKAKAMLGDGGSGQTMEFTFKGTRARVWSERTRLNQQFEVTLSGQDLGEFRVTSAVPNQIHVLWDSGELPDGYHTVRFRVPVHTARLLVDYIEITSTEGGPGELRAPQPIASLTAEPVSNTEVALSWHRVSPYESGHRIERSSDGGVNWDTLGTLPAGQHQFLDAAASAGGTYHYRVIAFNSFGEAAPEEVASATTPTDQGLLTAPQNLAVTPFSSDRMELTWTYSGSGHTGFRVERRMGSQSWTLLSNVPPGARNLRDINLFAGESYSYRIRAYSGSDFSAFTPAVTATIPDGLEVLPTTAPGPWFMQSSDGSGSITENTPTRVAFGGESADARRGVVAALGTPISLDEAGDFVELIFRTEGMPTPNNRNLVLRFGLFNDNGQPVATDFSSVTDDSLGFFGALSTGGRHHAIAAQGSGAAEILGRGRANADDLNFGGMTRLQNFAGFNGGQRQVILRLERQADGSVSVQMQSRDPSMSYLIMQGSVPAASVPTHTFNQIAFALGNGDYTGLTITDIIVHDSSPGSDLAPTFTLQPQSAQRQVGGSVSFTVEAEGQIEGGGPLSYQWTFDGQVIEGATSATLSLSSLTLFDAGLYRVGVTQEGLTTWSDGAVLSVEGSIPVIHSWPTASSLELGQVLGVSTLSGGSASVGGEFVFENPGLIPPAGTNPQTVVFLPSNPDLYETVTSEIPVTVTPPATAGVHRINFTDAVTDSDTHTYGAETWRRVNLQGNSSSGQFLARNHSELALPDISGSSGAVTFSAQASYTSADTGTMLAPGEDLFPATGHGGNARFDWFDAGNAELRQAHSYQSNNRSWSFTFAGFASTDEVTFEFVQRRDSTNRTATLRYLPAGEPDEVLYDNLNIAENGNAVYHRVTLSGAESYAFQLGPNGGWTGLFNAISVTVVGQTSDFDGWWEQNQQHFPGKSQTDSVVRQGVEMSIRDIWIAGLDPTNEDLFRITGWDEHGRPEFAPRHDGRVYTTYWTADLTADPVVWTELDAEAHMPEESQIFFRVDVRWSDE